MVFLPLSAHLIGCWSKVNCSYLFNSYFRQTPKGGLIQVAEIFTFSPNKEPLIRIPSLIYLFIYLHGRCVIWKSRAQLSGGKSDHLSWNLSKYGSLYSIWGRVWEGGRDGGDICGWPFKNFLTRQLLWMLVSSVVLQSKTFLAQGQVCTVSQSAVKLSNFEQEIFTR